MPRPRLLPYPCGLHMGPMPVPKTCSICERLQAKLAAEPAVPGYGVDDPMRRARLGRKAAGDRAGDHRTGQNEVRFPQKRRGLTGAEFLSILRDAGRKKKEIES